MTQPISSDRYPSTFKAALTYAMLHGEFIIPCTNPTAMRAKFYGFLRALRNEGKAELADSVEILTHKSPPRIVLRSRDNSPEAQEVEAALRAAKEIV